MSTSYELEKVPIEDTKDLQQQSESWLHSDDYLRLVEQATDCYREEYDDLQSWINDRENDADEAPYRPGSLPYDAREALQLYVNELNASCGVVQCNCGYNDMDYNFDLNGHAYWSEPFMEFCCCYKDTIPDDSYLMEKLKTLQANYKNSKDKIDLNLASAYKAAEKMTAKHYAYLVELKLGPLVPNS